MNPIVTIFISLVNSMSVVMVVAYLVSRMPFVCEILDGKINAKNKALLIVFFGLFSVYGTISGVQFLGAVANTRYIGPVIGGMLGGPIVGLGAGLIGGVHRFFFGAAFTHVSSSVSTVVIGLAAGLLFSLHKKRTGQIVGVIHVTLFACAAQVYHLAQILAFEKPFEQALESVIKIGIPMIITNTSGAAIFAFIIANHLRERKTMAERDSYLQAKERIESELRVATDIQMSMVPRVFTTVPSREEVELFASLKPAKEVGGDLYDFAVVQDDFLYFTVGDVSDKGVPAALFMAVTKTLLKAMAVLNLPPDEVLAQANREIALENDALMFVTVFCGKLNLKTGELVYSNAGHNPPLLLRQGGEVEWLKMPTGLVLGVDQEARYETMAVQLAAGDCVLAYTDGVTEAMNPAHQLFSEARLLQTAQSVARSSVHDIVTAVVAAVHEHASGEKQSDDITVLVARYRGKA